MVDLMLELNDAEVKSEAIQLHMHQDNTAKKEQGENIENLVAVVRAGYLNKNTSLCLPTQEDFIQATAEDKYLITLRGFYLFPSKNIQTPNS